jgi:hypothetical protein
MGIIWLLALALSFGQLWDIQVSTHLKRRPVPVWVLAITSREGYSELYIKWDYG